MHRNQLRPISATQVFANSPTPIHSEPNKPTKRVTAIEDTARTVTADTSPESRARRVEARAAESHGATIEQPAWPLIGARTGTPMTVSVPDEPLESLEAQNARLGRLGLVDGQREPILDRLADLARARLGAPIALVSIVQPDLDRQFFKSAVGLAGELAEKRQTTLAYSFCKYVRAANAPFVVLDAITDQRVNENPVVEEYGVIAYLGCPIHLPCGDPIGALCVIDAVPRNWSTSDIEALSQLAVLVDQAISFGELVGAFEAGTCEPAAAQEGRNYGVALRPLAPSGIFTHEDEPADRRAAADGDVHDGLSKPDDVLVVSSAVATPQRPLTARDRADFAMASEIWHGIEAGHFQPWYQPQFAPGSGRIVGAEALARWCRQDGYISLPGMFLPLAERLSVLDRIDDQIIRKATEDVWNLPADNAHELEVSVNLTLQGLFNREVIDTLRAHRARSFPVSVEILESVSIDDRDPSIDFQLDMLRDAGIRIGLDDFGSNKSSLLAFRRIRPDFVKIDRRIVQMETQALSRDGMLAKIIALSHSYGAQVVAEGIETASQASMLSDLGANVLQGFYFAQPMPVGELQDLLTAQAAGLRPRTTPNATPVPTAP